MTRAEKAAEAARLKAEGVHWRDAADELGVSRGYYFELLKDPDGSVAKARKRRYDQPCVDCGVTTSGSEGLRDEPRCLRCAMIRDADARRIWTPEKVVERIREWAELYGEPPAATDWNPTQARQFKHDEARARRFEDADGHWPHHTSVVRQCGSWNAAIVAAGFEPRVAHGGGGNQHRRQSVRRKAAAGA